MATVCFGVIVHETHISAHADTESSNSEAADEVTTELKNKDFPVEISYQEQRECFLMCPLEHAFSVMERGEMEVVLLPEITPETRELLRKVQVYLGVEEPEPGHWFLITWG